MSGKKFDLLLNLKVEDYLVFPTLWVYNKFQYSTTQDYGDFRRKKPLKWGIWVEYENMLSTTHKKGDLMGSIKGFFVYYPKPTKFPVYSGFISNLLGSNVKFYKILPN